jgi:hypothetical protein
MQLYVLWQESNLRFFIHYNATIGPLVGIEPAILYTL